jgi:hypothetical protein
MCNEIKTNFRGNRKKCLDCERKYGRDYRASNTKSKEWRENNKEQMKKLQSDWYKKNKEKINKKFADNYHNPNSDFKTIKNYRTALSHIVNGKQKTNKWIGCDGKFLKDWLSFCFDSEMTFENYGNYWTIDHVIPLDKRDEYSFEILAQWFNIQPIIKSNNHIKNKYIDKKQIKLHIEILEKYGKTIPNIYNKNLQDCLLRELP